MRIWSSCAAFVIVMSIWSGPAVGQMLIAHRGASYDAPENTIAAFKLALEQGADGFEADFYLSSDGRVITLHDRDTQRTAGTKLVPHESTFEQLRALEVGSWKGEKWRGEKIPSLEEVLAIVPPGKKIVIELKIGPEIVAPMAKLIEESGLTPEQIIIISFNDKTIAECERLVPQYRSYWLTGYKKHDDGSFTPTIDDAIATWKRSGADGYGSEANVEVFDQAFIDQLHKAGCKEFHVWTVDKPDVARHYLDLGAAWITTNRPGYLREQLNAAK